MFERFWTNKTKTGNEGQHYLCVLVLGGILMKFIIEKIVERKLLMISKTFDVKWLNKLTKDRDERLREAAKERLFVFSLSHHGNNGAIAY